MNLTEQLNAMTSHLPSEAAGTIRAWASKLGETLGDIAHDVDDLVQDALLFWEQISADQEDHDTRMRYLNTKLRSYRVDRFRKNGRRAEGTYFFTDEEGATMQAVDEFDSFAELDATDAREYGPDWYRTLLGVAEGEHAGRRLAKLSGAGRNKYAQNLLGKPASFDVAAEVRRLLDS